MGAIENLPKAARLFCHGGETVRTEPKRPNLPVKREELPDLLIRWNKILSFIEYIYRIGILVLHFIVSNF